MMFTVSDYLQILTHVTLDYTYVSDWWCRDIHVDHTVLTYDYVLHTTVLQQDTRQVSWWSVKSQGGGHCDIQFDPALISC